MRRNSRHAARIKWANGTTAIVELEAIAVETQLLLKLAVFVSGFRSGLLYEAFGCGLKHYVKAPPEANVEAMRKLNPNFSKD
jgi:hypothetical protein